MLLLLLNCFYLEMECTFDRWNFYLLEPLSLIDATCLHNIPCFNLDYKQNGNFTKKL